MSLIADGLLIATCLTTALYCLVLSRRLRRLSDTGEGVGQQVLRLNAALTETRAAVGEIRSSATSASDQLQHDIEAAKRQSQQLQLQIARALKSGVGAPAAFGQAAPGPEGARTASSADPQAAHAGKKARDFAVSLEPAVEFDAVDPSEGDLNPEALSAGGRAEDIPAESEHFEAAETEEDLDQALRIADAGQPDDPWEDDETLPEDDDEFVSTGDVSEAEDHWPFDPSDGDPEEDDVLMDGDEGLEDPAEQAAPRQVGARRGARSAQAEEGEAGLLRVERMAV